MVTLGAFASMVAVAFLTEPMAQLALCAFVAVVCVAHMWLDRYRELKQRETVIDMHFTVADAKRVQGWRKDDGRLTWRKNFAPAPSYNASQFS